LFAAIVTLKDPSQAEDVISKLNNTSFENQTVYVGIHHSERILCIAHLPENVDEDKFSELVSEHGNVEMCFLMPSEKTGIVYFITVKPHFFKL